MKKIDAKPLSNQDLQIISGGKAKRPKNSILSGIFHGLFLTPNQDDKISTK